MPFHGSGIENAPFHIRSRSFGKGLNFVSLTFGLPLPARLFCRCTFSRPTTRPPRCCEQSSARASARALSADVGSAAKPRRRPRRKDVAHKHLAADRRLPCADIVFVPGARSARHSYRKKLRCTCCVSDVRVHRHVLRIEQLIVLLARAGPLSQGGHRLQTNKGPARQTKRTRIFQMLCVVYYAYVYLAHKFARLPFSPFFFAVARPVTAVSVQLPAHILCRDGRGERERETATLV